MDNIFIDTNILLDVFQDRELFCEESTDFLFEVMLHHSGYISSLSYHIIMYVSKPSLQDKLVIRKTLDKLNTIPLTEDIVKKALDIDIKDYEDIIQFKSAVKHCRTIVTRDPKTFKKLAMTSRKKIEILSPKQWLKKSFK